MNARFKIQLIIVLLLAFNVALWASAYICFYRYPEFLALCLIAYGLGLRHAVDADHIATIDNVTRKFIQENKKPVGTGFFFSLGHSSVVIIMSLLIAVGTIYMKNHIIEFQKIGTIIGTGVSASFLLILAIINLLLFIGTYKTFLKVKKRENTGELDSLIEQKGIINKIFKPLFRLVSKSWHMYIIGFLFGLGFDTATEIALLGISSGQAAHGLSVWAIMIFPFLFMAGMCLIDTLDGVLMLGIYAWAFIDPVKKLFYNMIITLISFVIAFFIGGFEILTVISDKFNLHSTVSGYMGELNKDLIYSGYYIIGTFIFIWLLAVLIYKIFNKSRQRSGAV